MLNLDFLPDRGSKPRTCGVTMVMDKGLTPCEADGLCEVAGHTVDFVKMGFGTAVCSSEASIKQKIKRYHQAGIEVYLGGTLLEAAFVRGQLDAYLRLVDSLGLGAIEVSDGSVVMPHDEKCALIDRLSKTYRVLSEVGSKVAGRQIATEDWATMMQRELAAGSEKVIAEAREAGNIGIYDSKGKAHEEMIDQITAAVDPNRILWEAPLKAQQVWFVQRLGHNVNLGNIAPVEAISLETIRCGLRGDTFGLHLPAELKAKVQ